jgi:hypothetical protein
MGYEVNSNISIDKRSIKEIWDSCSAGEKESIRRAIKEKFKRSKVTIWHWVNGITAPTSINDRELIARIIKKKIGVNATPETLFAGK